MLFVLLVLLNLAAFTVCQGPTPCPNNPEPECTRTPVDIALVIDSTSSIYTERNFNLGKEFLRKFLEKFTISPSSVRVASLMFGNGVYTDSAFNFDTYDNKEDTLRAISELQWMGGTKTETYEGIDFMVDNFVPEMRQGSNVAHLAIVLTDGQSYDRQRTVEAAERARNQGVTIIAVGVGDPVRNLPAHTNGKLDLDELDLIAGKYGFVLTVEDFEKLDSITGSLIQKFCIGVAQSASRKRP